MYKPHPVFDPPPNQNAALWRFMDFTKFVSLLSTKALFFCRVDRYADDLWEGKLPKDQSKALEDAAAKARDRHLAAFDKWIAESTQPDEKEEWQKMKQVAQNVRGGKLEFMKLFAAWTASNCWHKNDHESDAMWRLYAPSPQGVAIRTTFARLVAAFKGCDEPVYIGRVRYIDYNTDTIPRENMLFPSVHKRMSYEHEKEVRALIWRNPQAGPYMNDEPIPSLWGDKGQNIEVDVEALIHRVYVSPRAGDWFKKLVKEILQKYGFSKPVKHSSLSEGPLF